MDAWLPILGTYNKRVVYIDGFSGPGQYKGGEPGSPIIALEAARTHQAKLPSELVFLFVEERQDRVDHLNGEIAKLGVPSHFKVHVEQGTFAEKLAEMLNALEAEGGKIAPTFALIDPFGFAGIPYDLIRRLLGKNKCEVLVTFMVDSINRWLTHPDDSIRVHIRETFGTEDALKIAFGGGDRVEGLKNLYRGQLTKAAKFVRYFEMRDRDGRLVYYLFFASNNAVGHLKMKEAMWKVDPWATSGSPTPPIPTRPYSLILLPPLHSSRICWQNSRALGRFPSTRSSCIRTMAQRISASTWAKF